MYRKAAFAFAAAALFAAPVFAADIPADWKDCESEIQKFCKDAKTNDAIFECIEKREGMGKKSGLSKKCYEAHEKHESAEHEKNEKHEGAK